MPVNMQAPVVSHASLGVSLFCLRLHTPLIAREAQAGQFVHVRCGDTLDPLLRRPLSLHRIDRINGEITLVYQAVGTGTRLLSRVQPGEYVDIMGPLGRGFSPVTGKALLVGGGLGIVPLLALAETLPRGTVTAVLGARTKAGLIAALDFAALGEVHIATDDGTAGHSGQVTDVLTGLLADGHGQYDCIYTCGPRPMLAKVKQIAENYGIPCQISLEEYMGCGVGACLACTCKAAGGGYKKVCSDGPVFWAGEVAFS